MGYAASGHGWRTDAHSASSPPDVYPSAGVGDGGGGYRERGSTLRLWMAALGSG